MAELQAANEQLEASAGLVRVTKSELEAARESLEASEVKARAMEADLEGARTQLEAVEGLRREAESRLHLQAEESSATYQSLAAELQAERQGAEALRASAASEARALRAKVESLTVELDGIKSEAVKACEWAEKVAAEAMVLEERCQALQVRCV